MSKPQKHNTESLRYFLDPFGCAKNQVDAEHIMAHLDSAGWINSGHEQADLIIVNSCGFIESAKQESINAVLAWRKHYPNKKIMLTGCLSQRYKKELEQVLPEADILFGITDIPDIAASAAKVMNISVRQKKATGTVMSGKNPQGNLLPGERPLLSLPGSAYVKISEGCNNNCSYCAIPLIRGNIKSRSISDIKQECKTLVSRGIKELCIIAQDIASYGIDFGKHEPCSGELPALLKEISKIKGDFWVRLLYIHPDHFPLEILDIIKKDKRFLPYFDLPFQHGSEKILRLMNRKGNAAIYLNLIKKIRQSLPDSIIRSTFLTGFPGETDEDFKALTDFQKKAKLDWAGCFAFSREEYTPAYSMKKQVSKKTAQLRKKTFEKNQIPITKQQLDNFIKQSKNQNLRVLIEEKIEGEEGLWLGRLSNQAPEVDSLTVISSDKELKAGEFYKAGLLSSTGFDLKVQV